MRATGTARDGWRLSGELVEPSGRWGSRRVSALRVADASMVDEGIREGDYLLVEPGAGTRAGQIVLVEVDGRLTVKRLVHRSRTRVRLQPAHPGRLPLVLAAGRARVVGRVMGVLRAGGVRPSPPPRPRSAAPPEAHTADPTLPAIERVLRAAEGRTFGSEEARSLQRLARSLRGLRDCYLGTTTPRLRRAMLREAASLMRELARFGVEPDLAS